MKIHKLNLLGAGLLWLLAGNLEARTACSDLPGLAVADLEIRRAAGTAHGEAAVNAGMLEQGTQRDARPLDDGRPAFLTGVSRDLGARGETSQIGQ